MNKKSIFYLGIGSNVGEREKNIENAYTRLGTQPDIDMLETASLYETAPVGKIDQPPFLNTVFKGRTSRNCFELLDEVQRVEQSLGRNRSEEIRWGPRTIDIDILLFCSLRIDTDRLVIPHPRMTERKFVLIPLLELGPNLTHPVTGIPLSATLDTVGEQGIYFYSRKRYSKQAEEHRDADNRCE